MENSIAIPPPQLRRIVGVILSISKIAAAFASQEARTACGVNGNFPMEVEETLAGLHRMAIERKVPLVFSPLESQGSIA